MVAPAAAAVKTFKHHPRPETPHSLLELPREVLDAVLRALPPRALAALMCTSRAMCTIAGDTALWARAVRAQGLTVPPRTREGQSDAHQGAVRADGDALRAELCAAARARANWLCGRYASRALNGAHTWSVETLKFVTAKGGKRLLVSGAWDACVAVWQVADGGCVARLRGHRDWVTSVDADARVIVSGSTDGTVAFWRYDCLTPVAEFHLGAGVTRVALLDAAASQRTSAVEAKRWPVVAAAASANGQVHVLGVDPGCAGAADGGASARLAELRAHAQTAWFVQPVLGGGAFLTAGRCGRLAMWALSSAQPPADDDDVEYAPFARADASALHDDAVLCLTSIEAEADGGAELVASGSADGTTVVYEVRSAGLKQLSRCGVGVPVTAVALGRWPRSRAAVEGRLELDEASQVHEGAMVCTGDASGRVLAWRAATGEQVLEVCRHTSPVASLLFARGGLLASIAPGDGVLVHACYAEPDAADASAAGRPGAPPVLCLMDGAAHGWSANGDLAGDCLALGTKEGAVHILSFDHKMQEQGQRAQDAADAAFQPEWGGGMW